MGVFLNQHPRRTHTSLYVFSNIDFDKRLVVEFSSRQTSNIQGRVITLSIAISSVSTAGRFVISPASPLLLLSADNACPHAIPSFPFVLAVL